MVIAEPLHGPRSLLDLLDRLAVLDIVITSRGGRLVTRATRGTIDDDVRAQIRTHLDMLLIVAVSRTTGHAPGPCTECSEISIVAGWDSKAQPRDTWPACRMTPGCEGHHQPRAIDLKRTVRKPTPKQAEPPPNKPRRLLGPMPVWTYDPPKEQP